MDTEPSKEKTPQDRARAKVLLAMYFQEALTDEILPPDKMEIFSTKLYQDWPKEMQEALAPFGAEMIR